MFVSDNKIKSSFIPVASFTYISNIILLIQFLNFDIDLINYFEYELRANIIEFMVDGKRLALRGSNMRPVVLNARSAEADVAAQQPFVRIKILKRFGKTCRFLFHHAIKSNFSKSAFCKKDRSMNEKFR